MCLPKCPETGKSSFFGEHDAMGWVKATGRGRKGWHPPHRAYRCKYCGYWHLTRQPNHSRSYRFKFMR